MKPTLLLALLVPSALSAACFVEVQSLSTSPVAVADGSAPPGDGAVDGQCTWRNSFYKTAPAADTVCSNISSSALIWYDNIGTPQGYRCGGATVVDEVLAVGPQYGLMRASAAAASTTCDLMLAPVPGNAAAERCIFVGLNTAGSKRSLTTQGDLAYLSVYLPNTGNLAVVSRRLVVANMRTGEFKQTDLFGTAQPSLPSPSRTWTDDGFAPGKEALYLQYGNSIWRKPTFAEPAVQIYNDAAISTPYDVYVTPGSSDVYALIGGQMGLRHRNTTVNIPIDELLVAFPDSNGVEDYSQLVYDRVANQFVLRSSGRVSTLTRERLGTAMLVKHSAQDDATHGRLQGKLELNQASTEAYFEERCATVSSATGVGPATSPAVYGSRVISLATGAVEWLWDRPGFPLIEGNRQIPHNGTYTARVVRVGDALFPSR